MAGLALQSVGIAFGGLKALTDVNLHLDNSAIVGLIGPNGAGKSTCINVITGMLAPTAGRVTLDGRDLAGTSASRIRRLGISRTFQAGRVFAGLSVRENVAAAGVGLGLSRRAADRSADETLAWMGLTHLAERRAGTLPYTDQRRAAIARALVERPAYLLLDEPAAGMSEAEAGELGRLIRRIHEELATAVLLVEHNIALVLAVCGFIKVLDGGVEIAAGPPAAIRDSAAVREAYLGTSLERSEKIMGAAA